MSSNLKKSLVFCASALMLCGFGSLIHQNNHVNADEVSDLTFQRNRPDFDNTNKELKSDFKFFRPSALNEAKNGVPEAKIFTHNKYIYHYLRKQGYTNHQINYGEFHKINESHQKQFGYHKGIPKALIDTYWHRAKHYNHTHSKYSRVFFIFGNNAPSSGEAIYNHHGKEIGGSAGSGSAWDAYYRYLGHHTYFIISGVGDDDVVPAKLNKHNILNGAPMMTSVKLLKHHRALINGNYYTLSKHQSKHIKHINKHIKAYEKYVHKSTTRTKRSHKINHRK